VPVMITKLKICLIGATGVGKSSLVDRFVHSIFSDTYRTTIGVKIEAHEVRHRDRTVQLVIWDLSGEDEFQSVQPAYVSGAAGYLLVIDGTRLETVNAALTLEARVRETAGGLPFVVVVNKSDLVASWDVTPADLDPLRRRACAAVETSARTGAGVDQAFEKLVDGILTRVPSWT
jgi:small GTP-binding protein